MPYFTIDFMIEKNKIFICEINSVWSFYLREYGMSGKSNMLTINAMIEEIYWLLP
jgi:hypothetical protein